MKPLLFELSVRDQIQSKLNERLKKNEAEVRAMKAVLKTPRMYEKFKTAVERRENFKK